MSKIEYYQGQASIVGCWVFKGDVFMIFMIFIVAILGFQGCSQSQPTGQVVGRSVLPVPPGQAYEGIVKLNLEKKWPRLGFCSDRDYCSSDNIYFLEKFAERYALTPGSAFITDSGVLASSGIRSIIHAAIGSTRKIRETTKPNNVIVIFEPILETVSAAIKNSLKLLDDNGIKSVAISLEGLDHFLPRIMERFKANNSESLNEENMKKKLARSIAESVYSYKDELSALIVKFIDHNSLSETACGYFTDLYLEDKTLLNAHEIIQLEPNRITDFASHQCEAILHFTNIEGRFGDDDFSRAIGDATGKREEINAAVQQAIVEYYNNPLNLKTTSEND
jgi:hypothetical protein